MVVTKKWLKKKNKMAIGMSFLNFISNLQGWNKSINFSVSLQSEN